MSTPARSFLHVIQRYYPFVGGSEDYFGVLSAYFAAHGDRVTVYTTDAWDLEHFWAAGKRRIDWGGEAREHAGVSIERFAVRRPPLWRLGYPVTRRLMTHLSDLPAPGGEVVLRAAGHLSPWVPGLERRLRETNERFDLVHTANIALEGVILAAAAYCRRRDVPFVVTPFVHLGEDGDRRVRKYYSMRHQLALLRQADAVIAQTARERRFLLDHGVPAERLHLAGAGVDPAAVTGGDGAAFRARHDIAGPMVAIIGTTAYDKGTPHVVEAMRRFWRDGGEATLVIAGPTMDHFLRYFAALPAADRARCRLLGFISAEEKRDLLAATDVFALPSRTDSFGIVYLESWCNGAPVIGARAGGVPDVIADGQDGLLVPFGDVPALAAALRRLLDDRDLAAELGARGRAKVYERYTWDRITAIFARIYDDVLTGQRARAVQPAVVPAAPA
ncbi:MAG: glycosyltransferase family 4 protein [Thermomicrobiales bacterium]